MPNPPTNNTGTKSFRANSHSAHREAGQVNAPVISLMTELQNVTFNLNVLSVRSGKYTNETMRKSSFSSAMTFFPGYATCKLLHITALRTCYWPCQYGVWHGIEPLSHILSQLSHFGFYFSNSSLQHCSTFHCQTLRNVVWSLCQSDQLCLFCRYIFVQSLQQ